MIKKNPHASVCFGLQAALSVLQHGFSQLSGDPEKPGEEIVEPRAAFKIFEQRFDWNARIAKYPGATDSVRVTLDSGARGPIYHG